MLFEKGPPQISEHDQPNVNEFNDMEDLGEEVGTGQVTEDDDVDWMSLAQDAFDFSTGYLDANYRKKWEDGIRAFNSQHPLDSKYNSPLYEKRSHLYRPKTRSAIRKNEAASASAFFSNMDVVNVGAMHQSDKANQASAEVMKQLLQYRLTSADQKIAIPWFMVLQGAIQDAQTVGVCISRQYWDYRKDNAGQKMDKPCVKLIPAENLRIDPAAEWYDPIGTSPYIIELMPMYVGDIKQRMKDEQDPWKEYSDGEIMSAQQLKSDSTRMVRNKNRTDPDDSSSQPISDYEIAWVQRHIHRRNGRDMVFYALGNIGLLTDPKPLIEEVFHGERDYVMGLCIIETHKVYPSGIPEISRPVQDEANEVTNQTLDNTKFVLNKRWFVKRGKNVDVASLVRNVPGGVTLCDSPEEDIKEVNWPDITKSAFETQNRLNADFSDLLGDFAPANAHLAKGAKEPAKVMQLMASAGTPLTEYLLATFRVTWVEPVLRQLIKLEQKYETDMTIMAIAAERGKILQKYGVNQITDELLNRDLTLTVNVGMGATDPLAKMQRFTQGLLTMGQIHAAGIQGLNLEDVDKELFALMGYQDGGRFLAPDAEKQKLQQALQMKDQAIQEMSKRLQDKEADRNVKMRIADHKDKTQIATTVLKHGHEDRHKLADAALHLMTSNTEEKADAA